MKQLCLELFRNLRRMVEVDVFCFLVLIVANGGANVQKKSNTLELVHVLFRHGDRTPEKHVIYPFDPHVNVTYYPIGHGQLTNAGKRKEYLLGKALHKRYGKFLGTYTVDTIDARSTDYQRTKMSLLLVLASLFPPENELVWDKKLKWMPIPFNYWPLENDHILGDPYMNCPRYKKLYDNNWLTTEGRNLWLQYNATHEWLIKHSGIDLIPKNVMEMYFTLTLEKENGLELPEWSKKVYPKILTEFADKEYRMSVATKELKRLGIGFLMKKIINDTRSKINGELGQEKKMFLYSAHEFNIAFILLLMGVYEPHVPPYGAYLVLEIHNVNGVRGVKMYYQDYTTQNPRRLKLPNCARFCRFERFSTLYSEFLPLSADECYRD